MPSCRRTTLVRERRLDLVEFIWICKACGADAHEEVAKLVAKIEGLVPPRHRRR